MYIYEIDQTDNVVSITATDNVNLQDGRNILATIIGDERFHQNLDFLVDVRHMTASPSATDLGQLADVLARAQVLCGRFSIVAAPGVQYALGRMIATLAGLRAVQMSVFTTEADARAWLQTNLPPQW